MNRISSLLIRTASKFLRDVQESQNTDKITVFLGGQCDDKNLWRNEIKKKFPGIYFLDPYDKNWEPEDNIYDELAGMLSSDYVVFYKGGKGSEKEKGFLDTVQIEYEEFDDLKDLGDYVQRVTESIKTAYDFSSVQCDLPREIADEIYYWGLRNIPEECLAENGRQSDIHVTIKYGLHIVDPTKVRDFLINQKPFEVTLGNITVFENDEHDVIKLDVTSPELYKLNRLISDNFEVTDTHPEYIPHITLGYVKPGIGSKYSGRKDFNGRKILLTSALFSGKDNRKTMMRFPKTAKLGPAIHRCPNKKWRIGDGPCKFDSRTKAEAAMFHWVKMKKMAGPVKVLLAPTWELAKDIDADVTVEAEYGSNVKKGKLDTLAHHSQEYAGKPPPCTVKPKPLGSGTILISHLDLDTIITCLDLMGLGTEISDKFRNIAGFVDVNGVHKLDKIEASDKEKDQLHAWWAYSKTLGHGNSKEVTNVTDEIKRAGTHISKIMSDDEEAMESGRRFKKDNEKLESDSFVKIVGKVIVRKSPLFVNHLYRHENESYKGVVALNTKSGSITIGLENKVPGVSCKDIVQELWGQEAGGHEGIAGSPRGERMAEKELDRAAEALNNAILKRKESSMRIRLTKIASITSRLDKLANEVEKQDPKMALTIDQISDYLEKRAFYSPMGWMPGRGVGLGRGWSAWTPGRRMGPPAGRGLGQWNYTDLICPQCGMKTRQCGYFRTVCPNCGVQMVQDVKKMKAASE